MNRQRSTLLLKRVQDALYRTILNNKGRQDPATMRYVSAILFGGHVSATQAVEGIKALDKAWGLRGSDDKAERILEVFALRMLSTLLRWLDEGHSEEDQHQARQLWGSAILTLFSDLSEDTLARFLGRDLQYQYELSLLDEERAQGSSKLSTFVGSSLLLSDALSALGARPIIESPPITGFPYRDSEDLRTRGGASERWTATTLGELVAIGYIAVEGAKACSAQLQGGAAARIDAAAANAPGRSVVTNPKEVTGLINRSREDQIADAVDALCELTVVTAVLAAEPINKAWADLSGERPMSQKSNFAVRSEFVWFFLHVVSRAAYDVGGAQARDKIQDAIARRVVELLIDESFNSSSVRPGFDAVAWRQRMIDDCLAAYSHEAEPEYGLIPHIVGSDLAENITAGSVVGRLCERITETVERDDQTLRTAIARAAIDAMSSDAIPGLPLNRAVLEACNQLGVGP